MDIYQFEQLFSELDRHEKKLFAEYINNQVLDLEKVNSQYEAKIPLTMEKLLDALSRQEDVLETIIDQDIDEAKDWLERELMK